TNQPQEGSKKLRRLVIIQVIIALVATVITVVAALRVYPLVQRKSQLEKEIATLEDKKADTQKSLDDAIRKLNEASKALVGKQGENKRDLISLIKPQAQAVPIEGSIGPKGSDRYDFKLWIDAPEDVKKEIAQVEYIFDHPSFAFKSRTITDPRNG